MPCVLQVVPVALCNCYYYYYYYCYYYYYYYCCFACTTARATSV